MGGKRGETEETFLEKGEKKRRLIGEKRCKRR
jgi:hypothetical protein